MKTYTTNTDVEITKEEAEKALAHYAQPKGRFVPEESCLYSFIDSWGDLDNDLWRNKTKDQWRLSQGNVFQNDTEALDHREYLDAVAVIKEDAEFWIPDWRDRSQDRWHGTYNHRYGIFVSTNNHAIQTPNTIYFENKEAHQKSQKEHLAEWKIYLNVK